MGEAGRRKRGGGEDGEEHQEGQEGRAGAVGRGRGRGRGAGRGEIPRLGGQVLWVGGLTSRGAQIPKGDRPQGGLRAIQT